MFSGATHVGDQQRPLHGRPLWLWGLPLCSAPRPAQVQHLPALHPEAVRAQQMSGAALCEFKKRGSSLTVTSSARLQEIKAETNEIICRAIQQICRFRPAVTGGEELRLLLGDKVQILPLSHLDLFTRPMEVRPDKRTNPQKDWSLFRWLCLASSLRKAICSPLQWVLIQVIHRRRFIITCNRGNPPTPQVTMWRRTTRWISPAWRSAWSLVRLRPSYWSWVAGLCWRSVIGCAESLVHSTDMGANGLCLMVPFNVYCENRKSYNVSVFFILQKDAQEYLRTLSPSKVFHLLTEGNEI